MRKTRKNVFKIRWRVSFSSNVKVELYGQKRERKGGRGVKEGKEKEERKADIMLDKTSLFKECRQGLVHGEESGEESNKDFSP